MKREYINPQMDVFVIKAQQHLLAGSPVGSSVKNDDADPSEDVLSRETDMNEGFFDEE